MQSIKNPTARYREGLLWWAALTGWLFTHISVHMSKASPAVESWVKGSEFRHEATPPAGIFWGAFITPVAPGGKRNASRKFPTASPGRRGPALEVHAVQRETSGCPLCRGSVPPPPHPPGPPNYGSYFSFMGPLVRKRDRAVTLKLCRDPPLQCVDVRDQWKKKAK